MWLRWVMTNYSPQPYISQDKTCIVETICLDLELCGCTFLPMIMFRWSCLKCWESWIDSLNSYVTNNSAIHHREINSLFIFSENGTSTGWKSHWLSHAEIKQNMVFIKYLQTLNITDWEYEAVDLIHIAIFVEL